MTKEHWTIFIQYGIRGEVYREMLCSWRNTIN